MKQTPTRCFLALTLTFLSLSALVQAHPGHSAIDWFSQKPHLGHEAEYGIIYVALALVTTAAVVAWKRNRN